MARVSERMRLMKENFMTLHQQGFTIPEIAEKYNLGRATVYHTLQEIADANGVKRESLLQIVRTPSERAYNEEAKRIKVDVGELRQGFTDVGNSLDRLIGIIDDTLREEQKNDSHEI